MEVTCILNVTIIKQSDMNNYKPKFKIYNILLNSITKRLLTKVTSTLFNCLRCYYISRN